MASTKTKSKSKAPKTKNYKYEPVLHLPPLSREDFDALRGNIAANGVLVPILVKIKGRKKLIIDGSYRKLLADECGYECPETVYEDDVDDQDLRTLARSLNLSRRHISQQQKRELIADQLKEQPELSNRRTAKALGVHHATVASVRHELESTGQIVHCDTLIGSDGRSQPAKRKAVVSTRSPKEQEERKAKTELLHGDCTKLMKKIGTGTIDAIITDPIYPEIKREYGRMTEADWLSMMKKIVIESRRVLKPTGSAVFILQPNSETIGSMRTWIWEFMAWAGKEWNIIQDVYWWANDAMPLAGCSRKYGLMRPSVKMCVWMGSKDCYRNQDAVLMPPSQATSFRRRTDTRVRTGPAGRKFRNATIAKAAAERGGTTPFNLLPISTGGQPAGREDHPASTPYGLADWWSRYILPDNGVLLDPFCGSGTMLAAGLDNGASKVIGIDKMKKYLGISGRQVLV